MDRAHLLRALQLIRAHLLCGGSGCCCFSNAAHAALRMGRVYPSCQSCSKSATVSWEVTGSAANCWCENEKKSLSSLAFTCPSGGSKLWQKMLQRIPSVDSPCFDLTFVPDLSQIFLLASPVETFNWGRAEREQAKDCCANPAWTRLGEWMEK